MNAQMIELNDSRKTHFVFRAIQDEHFVDLNLYQFGWEKCKPLHQFGPAIRNHFLFHYIISGKGKLEISGKTFSLEGGQGFLLCPGQISTYCADADDPWTYAWIEFDGTRARECMAAAGLSELQPVYTPETSENEIQKIIMRLVENPDKPLLRLIGFAMILLDEITQTSRTKVVRGNKPLQDYYIKEAIAYIEYNYNHDISIDEIAAVCGLNRSYFGRIFKEATGKTPQQFLSQYRMSKAAELLRDSRFSISEVGKSVGYDNQLHFSRAFKNLYGVSPRQYRNNP